MQDWKPSKGLRVWESEWFRVSGLPYTLDSRYREFQALYYITTYPIRTEEAGVF